MDESQADVNYNDLDRAALIATIEARDVTVASLMEAISKMKRQINAFNKKIFGSTSEKLSVISPEEKEKDYVPFEEVIPASKDSQRPHETPGLVEQLVPATEEKPKGRYKKPHPGRSAFPDSLERRPKYIYVEDYNSDTDNELSSLVSERLVINMDVYVEQTIRQRINRGGNVIAAQYPIGDPFYKHKLTLESVALMLMMRFNLHVPCYRLHQTLPATTVGYNTMLESMGKAYDELKDLGPVLLSEVKRNAGRLGIDEVPYDSLDSPEKIEAFKEKANLLDWTNAGLYPETRVIENKQPDTDSDKSNQSAARPESVNPLDIQREKTGKQKQITTGRLWVVINEDAALVYYHFSLTRQTNIAEWLLGDYDGLVISDAYAAYLSIANNKSMRIILMLCWAHARRRFTDLVLKDKPTDPVVTEVLRRIGQLYKIERRIKGKSDEEILAARVESTQLLELFKIYLEEKRRLYTPKEAVAEAIDYLLNHWSFFIEYTKHAKGILDNNAAERNVRPVTINRKNGLFFGSVKHSTGAALMLSFVENCKLQGIYFLEWVTDVLKRIRSHPKDRLDELLPHKWEPLRTESPPIISG